MTAGATIALWRAVHTALINDSALTTRLGGPKVFDEAPRGATPPYVAFGDARSRDWSTSTEPGVEHSMVIDTWSQLHGVQEALEISALVVDALENAALAPAGHRLILLRAVSVETRREDGGRFIRARQGFRAITEPI